MQIKYPRRRTSAARNRLDAGYVMLPKALLSPGARGPDLFATQIRMEAVWPDSSDWSSPKRAPRRVESRDVSVGGNPAS
jgi:hypothetical protein